MSDLDLTKNQNTGSPQNLKDQVADAGADLKQRAGDALQASTDAAQDKLKEAAKAAGSSTRWVPRAAENSGGTWIPKSLRKETTYPDQPMETVIAPTAYSNARSQPIIQAINSPSVA